MISKADEAKKIAVPGRDAVGELLPANREIGPKVWLLLAAVMLVAAFLLLYQLGAKSLWVDEIFTAMAVRQPTFGDFVSFQLSNERQPLLFWLASFSVIQISGQHSDFVMRLPAALGGLGAVFAMFWLGRTLGGSRLGLVASFFLALSPTFVLYARMARYYSFSVLFGILSCLCLVLWVKAHSDAPTLQKRLLPFAYLLSTVLMPFSAYTAVSVLFCQNVFALFEILRKRFSLKAWILAQLGVAIGFGAWIALVLPVMLGYRQEAMPNAIQGIKKIALTIMYPFYSFAVGETIFPWHPLAIIGVVVTAILLIIAVWRSGFAARYSLFMLSGTLAGTILIFVFVIVDIPFISASSRSIFTLPFFVLVMASGLISIRRGSFRLLLGGSLVVVYLFSLFNYFQDRQFNNPIYAVPAKEITAEIIAGAGPADVVISDWDVGVEYYWPEGQNTPAHFTGTEADRAIAYIKESGNPPVWLVTFGRDKTKGYSPEILPAWLDANYARKTEQGFVLQDPVYREIKGAILGYEDYKYKAMLTVYSN